MSQVPAAPSFADFAFKTIGQPPSLLSRFMIDPAPDIVMDNSPPSPAPADSLPSITPIRNRPSLLEQLGGPSSRSIQQGPSTDSTLVPSEAQTELESRSIPSDPPLPSTKGFGFTSSFDFRIPLHSDVQSNAGASTSPKLHYDTNVSGAGPSSQNSAAFSPNLLAGHQPPIATNTISVPALSSDSLLPFTSRVLNSTSANLYTVYRELADERLIWDEIHSHRQRCHEEYDEFLRRHDETLRAIGREKAQTEKIWTEAMVALDMVERLRVRQERRWSEERIRAENETKAQEERLHALFQEDVRRTQLLQPPTPTKAAQVTASQTPQASVSVAEPPRATHSAPVTHSPVQQPSPVVTPPPIPMHVHLVPPDNSTQNLDTLDAPDTAGADAQVLEARRKREEMSEKRRVEEYEAKKRAVLEARKKASAEDAARIREEREKAQMTKASEELNSGPNIPPAAQASPRIPMEGTNSADAALSPKAPTESPLKGKGKKLQKIDPRAVPMLSTNATSRPTTVVVPLPAAPDPKPQTIQATANTPRPAVPLPAPAKHSKSKVSSQTSISQPAVNEPQTKMEPSSPAFPRESPTASVPAPAVPSSQSQPQVQVNLGLTPGGPNASLPPKPVSFAPPSAPKRDKPSPPQRKDTAEFSVRDKDRSVRPSLSSAAISTKDIGKLEIASPVIPLELPQPSITPERNAQEHTPVIRPEAQLKAAPSASTPASTSISRAPPLVPPVFQDDDLAWSLDPSREPSDSIGYAVMQSTPTPEPPIHQYRRDGRSHSPDRDRGRPPIARGRDRDYNHYSPPRSPSPYRRPVSPVYKRQRDGSLDDRPPYRRARLDSPPRSNGDSPRAWRGYRDRARTPSHEPRPSHYSPALRASPSPTRGPPVYNDFPAKSDYMTPAQPYMRLDEYHGDSYGRVSDKSYLRSGRPVDSWIPSRDSRGNNHILSNEQQRSPLPLQESLPPVNDSYSSDLLARMASHGTRDRDTRPHTSRPQYDSRGSHDDSRAPPRGRPGRGGKARGASGRGGSKGRGRGLHARLNANPLESRLSG